MSCLWSKVLACVYRGEVVEVDERKFRIKKRLGDGQFSCVYLVQERSSGRLYALKRVVCHSKADEALVQNEIHVHEMVAGNVNLLPCEGYSVRPVTDYEQLVSYNNEPGGYSVPLESTTLTEYNILLPYYKRGTIQEELRWRLSSGDFINEKRVCKLFRDICHGLSGLHNLQPEPFVHGDLKTGNVLLSDEDDRAVLMDFGSSRPARIEIASEHQAHHLQDLAAERCTMYYRAPELFAPQVGDKLDERTDIWSLGCLLYALCFWVSPFEQAVLRGDSLPLMHLSLKQVIPIHSPYSKEMHDLIMCMLQPDRQSRPFLPSVLEKLDKVEKSAAS
ncbi:kinase domain protein [Trichuris suis]|nr:kinase domain protein [Trichuris suis]